jgi:hypothetical protein
VYIFLHVRLLCGSPAALLSRALPIVFAGITIIIIAKQRLDHRRHITAAAAIIIEHTNPDRIHNIQTYNKLATYPRQAIASCHRFSRRTFTLRRSAEVLSLPTM